MKVADRARPKGKTDEDGNADDQQDQPKATPNANISYSPFGFRRTVDPSPEK